MSRVRTHMTMSLDGYVATPDDGVDRLFDWYETGDVPVPGSGHTFNVDAASAEFLRDVLAGSGALVAGRRLFDIARGWGDDHPSGAPVVVVTHRPPEDPERWPRTAFVDGVAAAVETARHIAGDRDVVIASPTIIRQALDLGLVDEVCVSLVPLILGAGIPYFAPGQHRLLGDPTVVPGHRATHLRYPVR